MLEKIYNYDPAEALDSPEAIAVFIADAMETGDAAFIAEAIGVVDKARGMAKVPKNSFTLYVVKKTSP